MKHTWVLDKPDNLVDLIEETFQKFPGRPCYGTKNKKTGEYEWMTFGEVKKRVDNLRGGLAKLGVGKDDAVGIIANNRPEWGIGCFATYGLNARWVPMYEAELTHIWKYIIKDAGVKVLFVSLPEIYEKIKDFPRDIPGLKHIIMIEGTGPGTMSEVEKTGAANPAALKKPGPDDVACLIYTSGTTGDPKGVLLTHGNFTSNSNAGRRMYSNLNETDVSLSILPWAHSYGQTAEFYTVTRIGASIGFMENIKTLVEDFGKVKPTFLIAVPRVFNRIYDGLWAKMNEAGGAKKALFVMGVEAAKKRRALAEQGKSSAIVNLKYNFADKVVFKKIRELMGGRLKSSMTASAMMNQEIAKFFFDIGIPVYDCYGMTETSPAISISSPLAHKLGSVGKPIEKTKVVIDSSVVEEGAKDGEIVVYGPNVMKGYQNKPEATRQVMTEDGGLRTGDRGRLDEDGFLYITGRIKEQFKLENGKFVFPASLEEDICLVTWVANAVIYGENRLFTVCIIVPDFEVLGKYAKANNLPTEPRELIANQQVKDMITKAITDSLKGKYGGYEIPRKFHFITEAFTLENGTLTQTMKLKRRVVFERYQDIIEAMYK